MTVIDFPGSNGRTPSPRRQGRLSDTIEAATEVHDLIFEGLRCLCFIENPEGLKEILPGALGDVFGPDFVKWAETQFELVYAIDPYTFIDHIASYRDEA